MSNLMRWPYICVLGPLMIVLSVMKPRYASWLAPFARNS
jgi:hypothetical protein